MFHAAKAAFGYIYPNYDPAKLAAAVCEAREGNVGSVYWCPKDYRPIDTVYFIDAETSNCRDFLKTAGPLHERIAKLDETNKKLRAARNLPLPRLKSGEIAV